MSDVTLSPTQNKALRGTPLDPIQLMQLMSTGGLPKGLYLNEEGQVFHFYAGSEPPPAYLLEADSLIGPPVEGHEGWFHTLPWDTGTRAGFFDRVNQFKQVHRHYFTEHQPTSLQGTDVWFRKSHLNIRAVEGGEAGGMVEIEAWELFHKDESYTTLVVEADVENNKRVAAGL